MIPLRRLLTLALTAMLAAGCSPSTPPAEGTVELTTIKLSELDQKIQEKKGQVVVVDYWANWCFPCKMAFPHLVELQEKFGKQGVAAVSVNLDVPDEATRAAALKFLKEKNATFTNLALADGERPDDWFKKIDTDAIPYYRVYDKEGKFVQKFTGGQSYPQIVKLVEELLKK